MLSHILVSTLVLSIAAAPTSVGDAKEAVHNPHGRALGFYCSWCNCDWNYCGASCDKCNDESRPSPPPPPSTPPPPPPSPPLTPAPPSLGGTCWKAEDPDEKFLSIANYNSGYVNIGVAVGNEPLSDVNEYNYHLHVGWKDGADCGASTRGGHYDPTRACGGASDALCLTDGERQPGLAYLADSPDYAKCSTTNQDKCEVGDLSGRSGKVSVGGTTLTSFYFPAFETDFELDNAIDSPTRRVREPAKWSSLVMHCDTSGCGPRVGCAKYVEVDCEEVEADFVSVFGEPRR